MLKGKVAIVTGASGGIGRGTAIAFAKEGAKVAIVARSKDKLETVAAEIKKLGGEALVIVADISSKKDNLRAVEETVKRFGGLHIAFNNAGVFTQSKLVDTDEKNIDTIINVNIKGVIFGMQAQIPALIKTGNDGVIINNSSTASRVSQASATMSVYSASKAFVDVVSQIAAVENAGKVRINTINPGPVKTDVIGPNAEETWKQLGDLLTIQGRYAEPEEIADYVVFLSSDKAKFVTGARVTIDGGANVK